MYELGDLCIGAFDCVVSVGRISIVTTGDTYWINGTYFHGREVTRATLLDVFLLTGDVLRQSVLESDSYV